MNQKRLAKMARNCEKHFVGLNRIFLEEQWKKDRERKRPHLSTLNAVGDVKKWIPSIKREMNYCVEQLSGARKHDYSEGKLKEFEERLEYLEREYKRFVQKVLQLDPGSKDIPWTARPYKRKTFQEPNETQNDGSKKKKNIQISICQDLLDDKQGLLNAGESRQLSPLYPQEECINEKEELIVEVEGNTPLEKGTIKEERCTTGCRPGLVSYDSSDSDET